MKGNPFHPVENEVASLYPGLPGDKPSHFSRMMHLKDSQTIRLDCIYPMAIV